MIVATVLATGRTMRFRTPEALNAWWQTHRDLGVVQVHQIAPVPAGNEDTPRPGRRGVSDTTAH